MSARLRPGWRLPLLWGLAGWAALLSLESLFRPGGVPTGAELPQRLERGGRVWQRQPAAAAAAGPLPDGVVLLQQADYRALGAAPEALSGDTILLRRLGLTTSGTGVHLPVEEIGPALLGPGGQGRCVVLDADGAPVQELSSAEAWAAWMALQRPGRLETLAWLAGLRPYRANGCLWESLP
ncbi:MAG: hypothetical protein AB1Z21_00830 [Synechococcaceae cyanobacterium]